MGIACLTGWRSESESVMEQTCNLFLRISVALTIFQGCQSQLLISHYNSYGIPSNYGLNYNFMHSENLTKSMIQCVGACDHLDNCVAVVKNGNVCKLYDKVIPSVTDLVYESNSIYMEKTLRKGSLLYSELMHGHSEATETSAIHMKAESTLSPTIQGTREALKVQSVTATLQGSYKTSGLQTTELSESHGTSDTQTTEVTPTFEEGHETSELQTTQPITTTVESKSSSVKPETTTLSTTIEPRTTQSTLQVRHCQMVN